MNRHARQLFYFGWGSAGPLANPFAQAIAILRANGGSLWVASPAYTFTNSDGTGEAEDGSDAGYVRDLCASYGPDLVSNGDFSAGTAGWVVTGAGAELSATSGIGTVTNGSAAEASLVLPNTEAGKVYEVAADIVALSGTPTVYFVPPAGSSLSNMPRTGTGQLRGVFVSGGGGCRISVGVSTAGASFSIDNIVVREIIGRPLFQSTTGFKPKLRLIGGRWALVFDSTDDKMTYGAPSSPEGIQYLWLSDGTRSSKATTGSTGQLDRIGTGGDVVGACFSTAAMSESDLAIVKRGLGL